MNVFPHKRRRVSALQEKRRKQKRIGVLITLFVLSVAVVITAHIDKISIQDVAIKGISKTKAELLRTQVSNQLAGSYFYLFPRKNILLVPQNTIEESLYKKNPFIKTVDISTDGIQTLVVDVVERESNIIWCSQTDECYFIDEGLAYEKVLETDHSKYIVLRTEVEPTHVLGRTVADPGKIRKIDTFVSFLEREGTDVAHTLIKRGGDFEVVTTAGAQIFFNSSQEVSSVIKNLSSVINSGTITASEEEGPYEALLYIDLRFGKKIFYKFK